jgi:hypothetical protein
MTIAVSPAQSFAPTNLMVRLHLTFVPPTESSRSSRIPAEYYRGRFGSMARTRRARSWWNFVAYERFT